ncbi:MAG: uncharacterized protein KVP18_000919 [Porospora cf. gigantea A]|uniref:uncharacterized protein n=1 Tax=Porospora cf. gigantea A TaxID=2853593 RepID=UPI00355A6953|nr:MAG: hypothetical protein KVP18_000919 [Porospora cf. gigantea A]
MEISQQLHQSRERLKVEIDRCQALRTRERLLIQRTEAAFNRRVEVQTLVEKREMRMMELTHQRERLRRQAEAANLQKGDIQSKMTSQDAAETLTRRRAVRKIQSLMAEAETRRQELQERLCTTAGRRLQLEKTREELRQRSKVARGRLTLVLELPTISQLDQSTEDLHQHVESAGVARKRAEVQLERAQAGLTRLQTEGESKDMASQF